MSSSALENLPQDSLKNHWGLIEKSRATMAKEISLLADSLSGPRAKQLTSISHWLSVSGDYEAVLERPDVLCFCQPWVNAMLSKPNQETLNDFEIAAAIGAGFCLFENNAPMPRDLTPFLYPMIAFLSWLAIVTFGSIFVLPSFREMFTEFGIEVPWSTQFFIRMGGLLEENWIPFFAILLLVPVTLWILLRFSQRGKAYSLNWLDRRFARFRTKLSFWASHVARLLDAGVNENEAIQIAGRCSESKLLKFRCDVFVKEKGSRLLDPTSYPLISNSLLLSSKPAKIAILEETARYYQSLSGVVNSWWLAWLSKAILFLIVATLFLAITSLFMPLISIVSGLTGG